MLRKTCEHKEVFICECNEPSFDVLLGDFDYTQELGSPLLNPKSIGTRGFKVPHVSKLIPNRHVEFQAYIILYLHRWSPLMNVLLSLVMIYIATW